MDTQIKFRNGSALPRDPNSQKRKGYPSDNRYARAIDGGKYSATWSDLGGVVFYCSAFDRSLPYSDRMFLGIITEMTKAIHTPPPKAPARTSVG
jgi:hypothetical protein